MSEVFKCPYCRKQKGVIVGRIISDGVLNWAKLCKCNNLDCLAYFPLLKGRMKTNGGDTL